MDRCCVGIEAVMPDKVVAGVSKGLPKHPSLQKPVQKSEEEQATER